MRGHFSMVRHPFRENRSAVASDRIVSTQMGRPPWPVLPPVMDPLDWSAFMPGGDNRHQILASVVNLVACLRQKGKKAKIKEIHRWCPGAPSAAHVPLGWVFHRGNCIVIQCYESTAGVSIFVPPIFRAMRDHSNEKP
jgi:hypothetical protein